MKALVEDYLTYTRNAFYIGRGVDYYVSMEAALKLKEISYIQAEGFAAGELKHGTIALIEEGTPVIGIVTDAKVAAYKRQFKGSRKSWSKKYCDCFGILGKTTGPTDYSRCSSVTFCLS